MIHKHIFASPKPGMSEEEFHRYWIEEHATKYASKIKQIRQYLINTRVECKSINIAPWNGIAEIWIKNDEENLASLQSKEFLEGARLDEPKWAAFWNTLVLETESKELFRDPRYENESAGVKLVTLMKRKQCISLEDFRDLLHRLYTPLLIKVGGLRRYVQCVTRDSWYNLGEPRFDALHQLWFDSVESLELAMQSEKYKESEGFLAGIVESKYLVSMAVKETWIIGPGVRSYCEATNVQEPIGKSKLTPWTERRRSGAQAIAEQLKCAGLVGGENNLIVGNPGSGEEWLYLELSKEIQMGLAEAAVGSIVDGASRIRSKPAIAIAHGFVGFSGLQGDVFNAAQRQSPMLVIVGTADSQAHTGETHMYADVEGAAKAAGAKYVKNATDPETLLRDLRDSIIQAQIPPFGPVVFIVGSNVTLSPNNEQVIEPSLPDSRLAPPLSVIEDLASLILKSKHPAILIGDGIARSRAHNEVREVAELLGAEVWASMESEINFPRNHGLFRGNLGHMSDERGRHLLKNIDFALAVGTPIYQTVFNSKKPLFQPNVPIAAINPDPESSLRGHNDITFPVKGDPKQVLSLLSEVLKDKRTKEQAWHAESRFKKFSENKQSTSAERRRKILEKPGLSMGKFGYYLEEEIKNMQERPIIFNEALVGAVGLTEFIRNIDLPGKYFDTSGGSLGEWAGAVGAAIVSNQRTIAFIGDGGFNYVPQALWNASQKKLLLGLIVANNSGYGLLYSNMKAALDSEGLDPTSVPRPHYFQLPNIDFVKIAEGYGVPGVKVECIEQVKPAIEKMLGKNGPFLINLVLEPVEGFT